MAKYTIHPSPDAEDPDAVLATVLDGEDGVEVEGDGPLADDLRARVKHRAPERARDLLTGFSYYVIREAK
jgi:hypothetical protein